MKPKQHHCYEAEVKVKNRATLKPDANLIEGDIIKVLCGWIMEETESFPGQAALIPQSGYWIPEEDLILKKEISVEEYIE